MSFYDDLEVTPNATADEIKRAYRKLAIQHHPDKGGNPDNFLRIQTAYDTLSDNAKRQAYDDQLQHQGNPFSSLFSSFNFDFQKMFTNLNHTIRPKSKLPPTKEKYFVTIEQALKGHDGMLRKTLTKNCETCCKVCKECNGAGALFRPVKVSVFQTFSQLACEKCASLGFVFEPTQDVQCACVQGKITKDFDLNFYVPPHAAKEANITFANMGQQASRYLELPGDLIIEIAVDTQNAQLTYEKSTGEVIYSPVINIIDLIVGIRVNIPSVLSSLDSPCYIDIPLLTVDPTWIARIPQMGLMSNENSERADLVIKPKIDYYVQNIDQIDSLLLRQALVASRETFAIC